MLVAVFAAVAALGLGTHIVVAPAEALAGGAAASLRKGFGIPDDFSPLAVILVGHPAADAGSHASPRKAEAFSIVE